MKSMLFRRICISFLLLLPFGSARAQAPETTTVPAQPVQVNADLLIAVREAVRGEIAPVTASLSKLASRVDGIEERIEKTKGVEFTALNQEGAVGQPPGEKARGEQPPADKVAGDKAAADKAAAGKAAADQSAEKAAAEKAAAEKAAADKAAADKVAADKVAADKAAADKAAAELAAKKEAAKAAGAASPAGQATELNFKIEEYDRTSLNGMKAGKSKAEVEAKLFVSNASNRGPDVLHSQFFIDRTRKSYPVSSGGKLPPESVGQSGVLVPAVLVAKAMREVEKNNSELASGELQDKWLTAQASVLKAMKQEGRNPILDEDSFEVWDLMLTEWMQSAIASGDFRKALQEAPFEFVSAFLGRKAVQEAAAKSTPSGTGAATQGGASGTGSSFPFHERRMNHIYWHNDRVIARAERIRARR